jgi:dephospho-CoA kinase
VGGLSRLLVAVTGLPGSGKSLVARLMAEELGARVYVMGDVVRREVARRGLELTAENVERVARELRRERGEAAVAEMLMDELEGVEGPVVVDGLRSVAEAEAFRRRGWRVVVVAVFAPRRLRAERLRSRGRAGEAGDVYRLLEVRDRANISYGVAEAMALADYMIVNASSLEDLAMEARRLARVIACDAGKGDG